MSEADSITPSPRRGMNGSSEGSPAVVSVRGRLAASRPASRSQSSSCAASSISRWAGLALWASSALTSVSAWSRSWPEPVRSISAATLTSSRKRATAWFTSTAASRRISPRRPPVWATVSSSSSRMVRNAACSPSAGPEQLLLDPLLRLGQRGPRVLHRRATPPTGARRRARRRPAPASRARGWRRGAGGGARARPTGRPRRRGRTRAPARRRCPAPARPARATGGGASSHSRPESATARR